MTEPQIQYAKTSDGVNIAFATHGEGLPLVWATHSLTSQVQLEWELLGPIFSPIRASRKLIRFDHRACGLSDRGVEDLSLDALLLDLEAVVERLGLSEFALAGSSRGGLVAAAYAANHQDSISHLILYDAYARGADYLAMPQISALADLAARDWEMYTETAGGVNFGWDQDQARRFAELVRASVNQDDLVRTYAAHADYDITDLLPGIETPTLVIRHAGLTNLSMDMAKHLASAIPNARLVITEGKFGEQDDVVGKVMVDFLSEGEEEEAQPELPSGMRTILFTDVEGSTALTERLGDAKARELLREHEGVVREALKAHGGSEVKTMGDGFMASFGSATKALECAIAIQRAFAERNDSAEEPIKVRIGLNAGEPIAEDDPGGRGDLFGTAVNLAARIAAKAEGGEILASNVVRELVAGKDFLFADRGETELRGFEDPVRLYEVRWERPDAS